MQAAGMGDGTYHLGSMTVHVEGGVARLAAGGAIAGSTLTMDTAFRRTVNDLGLAVVSATHAAATTPARALGRADQIGAVSPGLRADLVVLDDDLTVFRVMRAGRWV
jgi:N-acetylglucosamine-6-phosphate deacetylase